ncbi:inorganic phosphate transporter, partial [Candidatus Gracilibacteria bacterium]|nr:inorganic phosphate transporter [Candidatus Gracilibacteria bacterium]
MKILLSSVIVFVSVIIGYLVFENAYVALAIGVGLYMAVNIGANDVANSVGPAVGSKAITIKQAILIAAVGNFSGAIIAGGDVVNTIKKGIIDVTPITQTYGEAAGLEIFVLIMLAALLAGGLWLTFATFVRAPVSTTHSIVGGVMGSGIAALGFGAVSWSTMGKIAASWFISPVLGGIIAALFLYGIKTTILFKEDKVSSAKTW